MNRAKRVDGRAGPSAHWRGVVAAVAVLAASTAHATSYDETGMGDLSNAAGNPTVIGPLTPGQNDIVGSTIPSGPIVNPMTGDRAVQDNDYVSFRVPDGYRLTQIDLASGSVLMPGDRMFFGIAQGVGVYLTSPDFSSAGGLLGWTLVDQSMVGSDVLPALGLSAPGNFPPVGGATGFSGPLGAGSYTLWMLDGDRPAVYDLDLVVAAVPEPSTWMLIVAGVGLLVATRPRRLHRSGRSPAPCRG